MNNLLSIEANFLSNVKQQINLNEIKSLQRSLTNGQKKKFQQTLQLSTLVVNAVNWFKSPEGAAKMAEEGIAWNVEEIGLKVFGWQKSFMYKMIKAGNLPAETIENFNAACDAAESEGKEANRTLEGLLKYAKNPEGAEGTEGAENVERAQVVGVFTFKGENGNVSVRMYADGTVKTSNNTAEIGQALATFCAAMNVQTN